MTREGTLPWALGRERLSKRKIIELRSEKREVCPMNGGREGRAFQAAEGTGQSPRVCKVKGLKVGIA